MVKDNAGDAGHDQSVNDLLAQYVHKLNNAMLPFVLELDDRLRGIGTCSALDQLKLRQFDLECRSHIESIRRIRALIAKTSEADFE